MNEEMLYAYLDGELSPEEVREIEAALAADPALSARLEALRRVDAALGVLPGCDASDGFAEGVRAKAARRRRGRLLAVTLPLAAAAAALVLAVLPREDTPDGGAPVGQYVWEEDAETFGSLALGDLQDRILEELEAT